MGDSTKDLNKLLLQGLFMWKFNILFIMPAIVVRVILFVYEEKYAWVNWGGSKSSLFAIVFALNMEELLVELRALGIGCQVAGVYMGAFVFCDDLLQQEMASRSCWKFAKDFNHNEICSILYVGKARIKPSQLTLAESTSTALNWMKQNLNLL